MDLQQFTIAVNNYIIQIDLFISDNKLPRFKKRSLSNQKNKWKFEYNLSGRKSIFYSAQVVIPYWA